MHYSPVLYTSYFTAFILLAINPGVIATPAGGTPTSSSANATCTSFFLVPYTADLVAVCDFNDPDGTPQNHDARIHLDNCIGQDNGVLIPGSGFLDIPSNPCQNITFDDVQFALQGACKSIAGTFVVTSLPLSNIVSNSGGNLTC
ncbi:hypothetical protein DFH07DRAFT_969300 [Mycena maculata]|uniref:Cyanovirin-N domain-containing protein n=1 Tax=Mycena maculata TaxID=230809 RepID=A0AAD7MRZ7_9AGAR|nr:hypothetical protein DFH07DRAFT_969300 [Mycena maculata]